MEVEISGLDLDLLTASRVFDIWTKKTKDGMNFRRVATKKDFDKF